MNKKILFFVFIALILGGTIIALVLRKTPLSPSSPPPVGSNVLPNAPQPPPSSLPLAHTTDEARFNAFKNTLKNEQGQPWIVEKNLQEHVLANEIDYSIDYFGAYDSYLIDILASPFKEKRKEAELRFLQIINAPPEVACQLKVILSTPSYANPDFAGNNFRLSFCR